MNTVSVAELKARLSEFLAVVRGGEDVVVTDRGRPVARLTALTTLAGDADPRLTELVRTGTVRPPRRRREDTAPLIRPAVDDPGGRLLTALLEEREQGR
jgi:prevent-host-death family protein